MTGQNQEPGPEERMGKVLDLLREKEDIIQGMIDELEESDDKAFSDALIVSFEDRQALVIVATIMNELKHDEGVMPRMDDLLWAMEFLDHLDTLGWKLEIRRE